MPGVEIVSVVVTPLPAGVTVAGLNVHDAPDGKPEQAKLTGELKPFCGNTITFTLPWPPELMVKEICEVASVNVGRLIA